MSGYPDNMRYDAGPYAPRARDLTALEAKTLKVLQARIDLLIEQKAAMEKLEEIEEDVGTENVSIAYDAMIMDYVRAQKDIERRPDEELEEGHSRLTLLHH